MAKEEKMNRKYTADNFNIDGALVLWELYKYAFNNNLHGNKTYLCSDFPNIKELSVKIGIKYSLLNKIIIRLAEMDLITIEYQDNTIVKNAIPKLLHISPAAKIEEITESYRKDCLKSLEILRNICNRAGAFCHYIDDDFYEIKKNVSDGD